jgi:hypothetical protein
VQQWPGTDAAVAREPFLARPWQGGITGWIVVFGALVAELVGGVVVNAMSMTVAAPVLLAPAAIALGFAVVQWLQVQSSHAQPAPWWHLVGIGAGLFTWQVWPTVPGPLQAISSNPTDVCTAIFTVTPKCLAQASSALNANHLAFWVTGAVVVALIALVRKSRIAAWAATPVAFAGCQLAAHFLEVLLLRYHVPGA